ncbi:MAG TPA: cysteine desulfurase, partial [Dehalococcoidia bacterium]|nr:cysteine desulfurase [Dehalococcoidia bacterium]
GDEVLLTEMEHHSNLVPWQMAARETGAKLRFVPVTDEGTLALDGLGAFVTERTKLVAMTQVSNALGTINPVAEVARAAHARGALMLVDGAQSVPHMPVDVQALDCDFLAFSGHKMLGPTGVGVLYVRPQVAKEMEPFLGGGEMIREVWLEEATWNEPPLRFEAGTPNIADVIGLGAAIDYLSALGMESVREHERELAAYALGVLGELDDLIIYGPLDPEQRGGVLSFNYADIHPHDLGTILDRQGVAVRAGHHCAMPLMRRLGVVATTRASFYVYTTKEEVDALAQALRKARAYFGHVAR